ncbi:MAG TPA: hypothetical protein VKP65_14185 [Rhodothermales bacterium]|nr:hypothetical protein [Rhodothermales bacterium]
MPKRWRRAWKVDLIRRTNPSFRDHCVSVCLADFSLITEHLGNAKVEQFHLSFVGDQDVRGLEVAVDDEVPMGVVNDLAHPLEET